MTDIIVVPAVLPTPAIGITEEGLTAKRDLLALSRSIFSIATNEDRDTAIGFAAKIKAHLKQVEFNRQEVLKPFHSTTAEINTVARSHVSLLEKEAKRLNLLIGNYEFGRQKEEFFEEPEAKARGGALRKDWDIKIIDLRALLLAYPQCVTMQPNMLAIKDLLKVGITPPGVEATPTATFATRAKP